MPLPQRKHPRLKTYDYSQCGCYHITMCVKDARPILSRVIPPVKETERARILLEPNGHVVERYIHNIPAAYPDVEVVKYVIMPNHVHLLIALGQHSGTSVPTIVRSLKRMVNRELGTSIWQDSYYDVIIKNDTVFLCEWTYIDNNPDKWAEDKLYTG